MSIAVHRCQFLDYERPGISAMAFNVPSLGSKTQPLTETRLAIGRSNGDIEIWNPFAFVCETVLPGARGRTVDDICWVHQSDSFSRLFTVGGTDTVVEWDLASGLPFQSARSGAGIIWAVRESPDKKKLAVATETGSIVLFDITDGQLHFSERLTSAETSLASLAWLSSDEIVAGGSDGKLYVWNTAQGRIVTTLCVDKQRTRGKPGSQAEETVIWAVLALPNSHQLASGDSNGFLKIWDTRTWSLQQSLQPHEGDVLCLATNFNGTSLFTSGLDQKIVNIRQTDLKSRKWTIMNSTVAHTHDIRCMASFESGKLSLLVSGGLESTFVVSSMAGFASIPARKIANCRLKPQTEVTGDYIVEWNDQTAQIWRLNSPTESGNANRQLKAKVKVSGEEHLTCASFDTELGLLALGTLFGLKLFMVKGSEIVPMPLPNWEPERGARFLKWAEPEKLVVVTDSDACIVHDTGSGETVRIVNDAEAEDRPRMISEKLPYTNRTALLVVSGGLVALARHSRLIDIFTLTGRHVASLPMLPAEITAMAFRVPHSLIVATCDRDIIEFDTNSGQLTPWSKTNQSRMPLQLLSASEPAHGIFTGIGKPGRAWLWGPSWLATIDFSSTKPLRKRQNRDEKALDEDDEEEDVAVAVVEDASTAANSVNTDEMPAFWISHKYKPIFYAGALGTALFVSEKPDGITAGGRKFWSNRRIQL